MHSGNSEPERCGHWVVVIPIGNIPEIVRNHIIVAGLHEFATRIESIEIIDFSYFLNFQPVAIVFYAFFSKLDCFVDMEFFFFTREPLIALVDVGYQEHSNLIWIREVRG